MSSHHIVREDQEPALFLQDPEALSFEKIQELLEWNPTVLVPFRHAETVAAWGIKIDVVLVQPHESAQAQGLLHHQPLKIISVNNISEEFATVVFFLKGDAYKGVYVVSHDSLLFDVEPLPADFNVEIFQGGRRWLHVRKPVFEKWYPAGTRLTIRSSTGIQQQTTKADGLFEVQQPEAFWVGESINSANSYNA